MDIGKRIKYLRCNLGFTQEELATAVSTTKQTIHKYETGIVSNIPASKIKAIADKLNTSPAYLMGWQGTECDCSLGTQKKSFSPELKRLISSAEKLTPEKLNTLIQVAENMLN